MNSDRRKNRVYLSLGSNLGNRKENLLQAIEIIENEIGPALSKSSIYETDSWGNEDLAQFLNMVILVESTFEAMELMENLLKIEERLGRIRHSSESYEARLMDIDILYFNNEVISEIGLEIPHPHMHKRNFVLVPLVEIAADFIHPKLNQSNGKLLVMSQDKLKCNRTI